jgi:hypothetical protein
MCPKSVRSLQIVAAMCIRDSFASLPPFIWMNRGSLSGKYCRVCCCHFLLHLRHIALIKGPITTTSNSSEYGVFAGSTTCC